MIKMLMTLNDIDLEAFTPPTPRGFVAQPREFEEHLEVVIHATSLDVDFGTEQSFGLSA